MVRPEGLTNWAPEPALRAFLAVLKASFPQLPSPPHRAHSAKRSKARGPGGLDMDRMGGDVTQLPLGRSGDPLEALTAVRRHGLLVRPYWRSRLGTAGSTTLISKSHAAPCPHPCAQCRREFGEFGGTRVRDQKVAERPRRAHGAPRPARSPRAQQEARGRRAPRQRHEGGGGPQQLAQPRTACTTCT